MKSHFVRCNVMHHGVNGDSGIVNDITTYVILSEKETAPQAITPTAMVIIMK